MGLNDNEDMRYGYLSMDLKLVIGYELLGDEVFNLRLDRPEVAGE